MNRMNAQDKTTMTEHTAEEEKEILRRCRYKFNVSPIKIPLTKEKLESFNTEVLTDKLCNMLEKKGFEWSIETNIHDKLLHDGKKIVGKKKDSAGYPVFFEMTMKQAVSKAYHITFPLKHRYNYSTSFADMKKWLVYAILVLDKISLQ